VGRDSVVGIATRYGLESPGIESRPGGKIFRTRPDRSWGLPSLLYNGYRVSYPWVRWPWHGVDPPTPSSTEVKEGVELYLCSPSACSWAVLGWTSPFIFTFIKTIITFQWKKNSPNNARHTQHSSRYFIFSHLWPYQSLLWEHWIQSLFFLPTPSAVNAIRVVLLPDSLNFLLFFFRIFYIFNTRNSFPSCTKQSSNNMSRFYVQRRTFAHFLLTLVLEESHERSATMMLILWSWTNSERKHAHIRLLPWKMFRTGVDGSCSTGSTEILLGANAVFWNQTWIV